MINHGEQNHLAFVRRVDVSDPVGIANWICSNSSQWKCKVYTNLCSSTGHDDVFHLFTHQRQVIIVKKLKTYLGSLGTIMLLILALILWIPILIVLIVGSESWGWAKCK